MVLTGPSDTVGVRSDVFQLYVTAPFAVSVVLSPEQMDVLPVIPNVGFGCTVMLTVLVLAHPLALYPITVYVEVTVGEGFSVAPEAPVLQLKLGAPEATSVPVLPGQMALVSELMATVGTVETYTLIVLLWTVGQGGLLPVT